MRSGSGGVRPRVLVIGGYGAVGAAATSALARWFPGRVVPAGRDEARARRLGGVRVDVAAPPEVFVRETLEPLGDIGAVVFCVEPPDAGIARACLERGVHVVDVGASLRLLDAVAALDAPAREAGATGVLSVGVAPGLTNLLARRAHEAVGGAERLDLTLLFGSGERHGVDALRWTLANLAEPEPPGARPLRVTLPGYGAARTAHPFPFSDQFTLVRTLGVPSVTTRLCLDSRPLTAALFALRRTGAVRAVARRPGAPRAMAAALHRVRLGGGDGFAVRVDARGHGPHARRVAYALTGREQSRVTGLVAAHVARELLTGGPSAPGVHHIEQLPAFAGIVEAVAADAGDLGVKLHELR
ncbi:saccharopine dehydrogenase NADP-binding domain-containing protein [Streptomyces sp. NPDC006307]|uniref:saccharopine dehydrogenase family protein n=1 Tax=Streptomyces sp. NPDC006307 TaxID=3156748 RepID=UPI0033A5E6B3